jgi:hypothetical protein
MLNPSDRDMDDAALGALFTGDIPRHDQLAYYLDENIMPPVLIEALRANRCCWRIQKRNTFGFFRFILNTEIVDLCVFSCPKTISPTTSNSVYVTTVVERGHGAEGSDFAVLADARRLGCVLVTRDRGFVQIHDRVCELPDASHAGVMLFDETVPIGQVRDILLHYAEKSVDYPQLVSGQLLGFGRRSTK